MYAPLYEPPNTDHIGEPIVKCYNVVLVVKSGSLKQLGDGELRNGLLSSLGILPLIGEKREDVSRLTLS